MNGNVPKIQVANGREFPLSLVTKISGTMMREYGTGSRRKTEFIVYVYVNGTEYEGIISRSRPAADAYRQKWQSALTSASAVPQGNGADALRRQAFAIMKALDMPLRKAGVSERQVWDLFQAEYEVTSRSKFTEKQWACVAATLKAAQDDAVLLKVLIDKVKALQQDRQADNAQVVATGAVHTRPPEQMTEADRLRQEWAANPQF